MLAQPFQQGFQRGEQFQPLSSAVGAGLAFGQKPAASLRVACLKFGRSVDFLLTPFLFQFGKSARVEATFAIPI